MGAHRIGELELVLDRTAFVRVLEEIIDPLLLHQPADEIEVGFLVLNAMIESAITAGKGRGEVIEAMILENLFQDAGYGHIIRRVAHAGMEDAAIRRAREKPKPGHNRSLVAVETFGPGKLNEGIDVATEETFLRL